MSVIDTLRNRYSRRHRHKRVQFLANTLAGVSPAPQHWQVLDLGGGNGENMSYVADKLGLNRDSIIIADISSNLLKMAEGRGFRTLQLKEEESRLPFEDKSFDFVFCSSVIEHVTTYSKKEVSSIRSGDWKRAAWQRQSEFATEICRVAKSYYVQTPNRFFPIESHTCLPFVAFLPRRRLVAVMAFANRHRWPIKTIPDFNLLSKKEMRQLFPDSEIYAERSLGIFSKSWMAIKTTQPG